FKKYFRIVEYQRIRISVNKCKRVSKYFSVCICVNECE
ncbi:hypothetical protein A5869_002145, partial [Enterococcus cecorum]